MKSIRERVKKCITLDDLNQDERILFRIIGCEFLKVYDTDFSGAFYVTHIATKRKAIQKAILDEMSNGNEVNVSQWASELGVSSKTILKLIKEIYEQNLA